MKRGRVFIYLALLIILIIAAGGAYLYFTGQLPITQPQAVQETPQVTYVEIITAGQNINPGTSITEAMLSTIQIPDTALVQGLFTSKAELVELYAKYPISQGIPITDSMVSVTPGNVNLPGSSWAPFIPQGLTAVAIPINRLSSVAYGIRDGDYVNVIVTMLLVDVDPSNQTILPNYSALVRAPWTTESESLLTAKIESGGEASRLGVLVEDETLGQPLYVVPSEGQRARQVTQMIMQNVQVLHVGTFPLPGEATSDLLSSEASTTAQAEQTGVEGQQTVAPIIRPDIITLMVSPNDANTLVYLIYGGAKITLTLRNPNSQELPVETDAAMLEYLLTQYNIPIPAKLPYSPQPRLDVLEDPVLPNDSVTTP
jgi:Flp pilus assembly protein CpaB